MKRSFLFPVLLLALALSGCGALFQEPLPTPLPPELIGTAIVQTQTGIVAGTEANAPPATDTSRPTRTPLPSDTPRPTWTASITPSPTVTFVINIPVLPSKVPATATVFTYPYSPIPGYQAANGCDLVGLEPKWGQEFPQGASFDAVWTFANYGPYTWDEHEVDLRYVSGEKLYKYGPMVDLPDTVLPGGQIKVIVDMVAPNEAGSWVSTWLLAKGDLFLCQVSISIRTDK